MSMNTFDRDAMSGTQSAYGAMAGYTTQEVRDRTDLEAVLERIEHQSIHIAEIEKGLDHLRGKLAGDIKAVNGGASAARPMRSGMIGSANDTLDDIEATLGNCLGILQTLRGLV